MTDGMTDGVRGHNAGPSADQARSDTAAPVTSAHAAVREEPPAQAPTAPDHPTLAHAADLLVRALRRCWAEPGFRPSYGGLPTRVDTDAVAGAWRLPASGALVRGVAGVQAEVRHNPRFGGGPPNTRTALYATLPYSGRPPGAESGSQSPGGDEAAAAHERVLRAVVERPALARRLHDGQAMKHYEPEELDGIVAGLRGATLAHLVDQLSFPVTEILAAAFDDEGFAWESRERFAAWDRVAPRFVALCHEVETRTHYEYEAVAYLNGPLVDAPGGVSLGPLAPDGSAVVLAYATDEALARAAVAGFWPAYGDLPPALRTANTTLTFGLRVPVDAPVRTFLNAYPAAADRVARVLDVLRIVRGGDIGVLAVRILGCSRHTPEIRRSYSTQFEPEVAHYLARRFIYGAPSDLAADVLGADELDAVRALLPRWLAGVDQRGLPVAIARFRDSHERYHPDDPSRLLDVAIALEALLLNDSDKRDVGYRLRVRGARWLADGYEARRTVASTLRDLYDLRSRIAHGDTMATLGPKDRARLTRVLADAPQLLRRALRMSIEGKGPEGLSTDALQEYWQRLELS